jgi:hypothetical protein
MNKPKGDSKPYLAYLGTEMTIQGILSAFAMAIIGFVLDRVLSVDSKVESLLLAVRCQGLTFVLLGSGASAVAALLFYLQRSYLARTYGGIASAVSQDAAQAVWEKLPLADQIGWSAYNCGFGALTVAAAEFVLALASRNKFISTHWIWLGSGPFVLGVLVLLWWFKVGTKSGAAPTFAEQLAIWLGQDTKRAQGEHAPDDSPARE